MTVSLHSDSATATTATYSQANGHYPAKPTVSNGNASPSLTPPSQRSELYNVCNALKERLEAFLAQEPETDLLRNVQARLRVSMDLTEESLRKYRYETASAMRS